MTKNKPIEVGCRVICIAGLNSGSVGAVKEKVNPKEIYKDYIPQDFISWVVESLNTEGFKVESEDGEPLPNRMVHLFKHNSIIRLPDEEDVEEFDKEQGLENV